MFPYRDENETQRVAIVTGAIIAVNVLVWLFIQGAGSTIPLASSVCELGLIPGESTLSVPPGARFPMGDKLVCLTDPGRQVSHLLTSMFLHGRGCTCWATCGSFGFSATISKTPWDGRASWCSICFADRGGIGASVGEPGSVIPMAALGRDQRRDGRYLILFPAVRVRARAHLRLHHLDRAAGLGDARLLVSYPVCQRSGGLGRRYGRGRLLGPCRRFCCRHRVENLVVRRSLSAHRAGQWRPRRLMFD